MPAGRRKKVWPEESYCLFDLARVLKGLGLSEAEVARRAKIDPSKINKWARGVSSPSWSNAVRLARAMGVSVGEFQWSPPDEL